MKEFVHELQFTARNLEETCLEYYGDPQLDSISPFPLAEDYLDPQMFPEEPYSGLSDHEIQTSSPTLQPSSSLEAENTDGVSSQPHDDCNSETRLQLTTVNPHLISGVHPVGPRTRIAKRVSGSSTSLMRDPGRRTCLHASSDRQTPRRLGLANREIKSRINSTRSSQRQRSQSANGHTNILAPSNLCSRPRSVVDKLIQGVGGILSIIQLKEALRVRRKQLVASNMTLPHLTRDLWKRLDLLETNTHTNNIVYRLCLVRLNSRRKDLKKCFSAGRTGKSAGTQAIDKIAADAEEENREKVKNRLHAGTIWDTISDEFSTGLLALVPSGKADCPSNTA